MTKEKTSAKMLSLENSLWRWLAEKAKDEGLKNSQQFIATQLRRMKAEFDRSSSSRKLPMVR